MHSADLIRMKILTSSLFVGVLTLPFLLPFSSARADLYQFTTPVSGQYTTGANWTDATNPLGSGVVPNLQVANTAQIANGAAVSYTPGGDLIIKNGGQLEVTNGSFTQVGGNNYLQLNGNGSILVDGGTFNQGTDSANPFSLNGTTGNAFTITSGAANFTNSFQLNSGLTYTQSGGTVTIVSSAEFDFNISTGTLSGGTLSTRLITGINGGGGTHYFNISGGTLSLGTATDHTYIYAGAPTHYLNFTANSQGVIDFSNSSGASTISQVQGFITAGGIEYNNAVSPLSDFLITQVGNDTYLRLNPTLLTAIPEPSSVAGSILLGAAGLFGVLHYRRRQAAA